MRSTHAAAIASLLGQATIVLWAVSIIGTVGSPSIESPLAPIATRLLPLIEGAGVRGATVLVITNAIGAIGIAIAAVSDMVRKIARSMNPDLEPDELTALIHWFERFVAGAAAFALTVASLVLPIASWLGIDKVVVPATLLSAWLYYYMRETALGNGFTSARMRALAIILASCASLLVATRPAVAQQFERFNCTWIDIDASARQVVGAPNRELLDQWSFFTLQFGPGRLELKMSPTWEHARVFRLVTTTRGRMLSSTVGVAANPSSGHAEVLVLMSDPATRGYGLTLSESRYSLQAVSNEARSRLHVHLAHCWPY